MIGEDIAGLVRDAPLLSGAFLADLTSRFVRVPSVNGEHPERDLALVISDLLEPGGFTTTLIGTDDRPSLAAVGGGEPRVVLNGHLDTVPVDDAHKWRFGPYEGVITDGAVHGRGACDMKGGLAVEVAVALWLAEQGLAEGLVLHFAMGEERGEPGTESLIEAGFIAPKGIVLEPTDLQLGVAQRGLMTLRIAIEGRAGHASRPDLTHNPLELLPAVLEVLARLNDHPTSHHRLLGSPAWTPTVIRSGVIPSMVPGRVEILVDRRMVPGETTESVVEALEDALAGALPDEAVGVEIAEEEGIYDPAEIDEASTTVATMSGSLEMFDEQVNVFGTPYSSDVRHLINTGGVDAVTFGPGRFSEMHARDELIDIDDLTRAARVVAAFTVMSLGEE